MLNAARSMHFSRVFFLPLFALLSVSAEDTRPASLVEQYRADNELLSRHYEIAGESTAAQARHRKLLDRWLSQVNAIDFAKLAPDDQVDAVLLRNDIERSLLQLDERTVARKELAPWIPFRDAIDALADARVHGDAVVPEKAAAALAAMAKSIAKIQSSVKAAKEKRNEPKGADKKDAASSADPSKPKPKPAPTIALPTPYQALAASEVIDHLAGSLKSWFENYNGFVPEFSWWVKEPHDSAAKALTDYAKYLREEIAGVKKKEGVADDGKDDQPLLGKSVGAEQLQHYLDHEFIPYTPQELIALAEREFAWCEEQMKLAAQEMKLGDDWKKALQRVKLQHMKPGEQEAFVRAEARRAIAFVKEHQLVTVPADCEEWWGTQMLPLSAQRVTPYAAYGGHDILVAYANENMNHDDKMMSMRGNNRSFTRNVVPHELIPGHHLQLYMAARERPYRQLFRTPFFVEGWALYWEMHLYDLKYQTTPEDRIGALFWRMHRCARIIVTLKFHLGEMKPEEMVKFLTDRVGHEKFGATSEVRRFIKGDYAPLYQCGYMLGGLQLIALHKELVDSGKMTEQQFHDAILKFGPIPVELIRASLLQQPLTPDYRTQWKFDDGK
jgi:uncharacterized protein (DUF885 family)